MTSQPLWLRDLVAYSIQAAALAGVGVGMARLLRIREPRVRLAYWQSLLAICLFLPLLQPWRREVLTPAGTVLSSVSLAAGLPAASPSFSLAEIVLLVLCAGIALRGLWMMMGMVRLWVYRHQAQQMEQAPQAIAEAQRLIPVSAEIFISPRLQTPATFGFFRPTILFPSGFLEMEPAMRKAIALHELLHVEHRDWLWNLAEEIILTVLWFQLPVWWAVRVIRISREQVVDAEAVRRGNERRPYLKALLEMAGQKRLAERLPATLFLREGQLAERVELMMKEAHMSRKQIIVSILAAAGALLIAGASVVWAFPLKTSVQQAGTPQVSSTAAGAESGIATGASLPGTVGKSSKIYKVGGNVQGPIAIFKPVPPYTPQARKAHVSGSVVLSFMIDAKGKVSEVTEQSKPLGKGLDESAIKTVRTWKFKPATRDGVPVAVKVMMQGSFRYNPNKKSDLHPQPDPQPQVKQPAPAASKQSSQEIKINRAEIQRQVERAMKQAEKAQKAAAKIDHAKIQKQVDEAMKQARIAQQVTRKLNSAEMQRKLQEAMKQAGKLNSAEIQRQLKQAMEQAKLAQMVASKIDQAKIQKQVEEALKQARAAQKEAEKAQQKLKKLKPPSLPTPPASPLPPSPPPQNQ